jgi:hypothetical protein
MGTFRTQVDVRLESVMRFKANTGAGNTGLFKEVKAARRWRRKTPDVRFCRSPNLIHRKFSFLGLFLSVARYWPVLTASGLI